VPAVEAAPDDASGPGTLSLRQATLWLQIARSELATPSLSRWRWTGQTERSYVLRHREGPVRSTWSVCDGRAVVFGMTGEIPI